MTRVASIEAVVRQKLNDVWRLLSDAKATVAVADAAPVKNEKLRLLTFHSYLLQSEHQHVRLQKTVVLGRTIFLPNNLLRPAWNVWYEDD